MHETKSKTFTFRVKNPHILSVIFISSIAMGCSTPAPIPAKESAQLDRQYLTPPNFPHATAQGQPHTTQHLIELKLDSPKEFSGEALRIKKHPISANLLYPSLMESVLLSQKYEQKHNENTTNLGDSDKHYAYRRELELKLIGLWRPKYSSSLYMGFSDEELTVKLRLTILANGELVEAKVLNASPAVGLDESVLEAVQAGSPYKPLPSIWGLERVNIYMDFEIKEN